MAQPLASVLKRGFVQENIGGIGKLKTGWRIHGRVDCLGSTLGRVLKHDLRTIVQIGQQVCAGFTVGCEDVKNPLVAKMVVPLCVKRSLTPTTWTTPIQ